MVFIAIPPVRLGAPYITVAFEFINTDGFRELGWPAELDGLKDRLDGALGGHGSALRFRRKREVV